MGGLFLSQRSSSCLGKENKGCEELITGELFFRCYIDYIVLRKKERRMLFSCHYLELVITRLETKESCQVFIGWTVNGGETAGKDLFIFIFFLPFFSIFLWIHDATPPFKIRIA